VREWVLLWGVAMGKIAVGLTVGIDVGTAIGFILNQKNK